MCRDDKSIEIEKLKIDTWKSLLVEICKATFSNIMSEIKFTCHICNKYVHKKCTIMYLLSTGTIYTTSNNQANRSILFWNVPKQSASVKYSFSIMLLVTTLTTHYRTY